MQPFITFKEPDKNNIEGYYILQKKEPHYCARIYTQPTHEKLSYAPVAGYNLYVTFDGTLQGNFLPYYKGAINEIHEVMMQMANWFLNERIIKNEKRYFKFIIKN